MQQPQKKFHQRNAPESYQGKKTLEVLEFANKYNDWIASQILPHIVTPALEIGAGTGNITRYIAKYKKPLYISEIDKDMLVHLTKLFSQTKDYSVISLDIENDKTTKFHNHFASMYSVNVLEHIQDDTKALQNMHDMLRPNGRLVLLVPAKKFAYVTLDKTLGHYRRYEKKELSQKLAAAGFAIQSIKFFNIVGLMSWYVRDKIDKGNPHLSSWQVTLFENIVPLLRVLESSVDLPMGISLIAVCKKI